MEEIKEKAPSVFATRPHKKCSEKYVFVPTTKIIEDFGSMGWLPTRVSEGRSKVYTGYQRHMVVFSHPDFTLDKGNVMPNIIVSNGHNRLSSLQFHAGLDVKVCSNGLVMGNMIETFKAIHVEYSLKNVQQTIDAIFRFAKETASTVKDSRDILMTKDEQSAFAYQSALTRWNKDQIGKIVQIPDILHARREEDDNDSLWSTYNRVQENIIKGGIPVQGTNGREIYINNSAPITEFKRNLNINIKLWMLMQDFLRLKRGK
jgi:hypothetical protein